MYNCNLAVIKNSHTDYSLKYTTCPPSKKSKSGIILVVRTRKEIRLLKGRLLTGTYGEFKHIIIFCNSVFYVLFIVLLPLVCFESIFSVFSECCLPTLETLTFIFCSGNTYEDSLNHRIIINFWKFNNFPQLSRINVISNLNILAFTSRYIWSYLY